MGYNFSPRQQMEYEFPNYKDTVDYLEKEVVGIQKINSGLEDRIDKLETSFSNLLHFLVSGAVMADETREEITKILKEY